MTYVLERETVLKSVIDACSKFWLHPLTAHSEKH